MRQKCRQNDGNGCERMRWGMGSLMLGSHTFRLTGSCMRHLMRWRFSLDLAKTWHPIGSVVLSSKDNGWKFQGTVLEDWKTDVIISLLCSKSYESSQFFDLIRTRFVDTCFYACINQGNDRVDVWEWLNTPNEKAWPQLYRIWPSEDCIMK